MKKRIKIIISFVLLGASIAMILLTVWGWVYNFLLNPISTNNPEEDRKVYSIILSMIFCYLVGFGGLGFAYSLIVQQTKELLKEEK